MLHTKLTDYNTLVVRFTAAHASNEQLYFIYTDVVSVTCIHTRNHLLYYINAAVLHSTVHTLVMSVRWIKNPDSTYHPVMLKYCSRLPLPFTVLICYYSTLPLPFPLHTSLHTHTCIPTYTNADTHNIGHTRTHTH